MANDSGETKPRVWVELRLLDRVPGSSPNLRGECLAQNPLEKVRRRNPPGKNIQADPYHEKGEDRSEELLTLREKAPDPQADKAAEKTASGEQGRDLPVDKA